MEGGAGKKSWEESKQVRRGEGKTTDKAHER